MKGSNFKLLSNILRGAWYMHPEKAFAQMPLIEKLIAGEIVFEEDNNKTPIMEVRSLKAGIASFQNNLENVTENSIALISIRGSLMKEDYCGDPGMATIGKLIQQADSHKNITGTVLVIDSPGGTVDGTEAFAKIIRSSKKPIVSFVDGIAASAAYWAASSTNHIMLSGETAEVGSIGTMVGFRDYSKAMEDKGIKDHFIFATKSTEKWASYLEALKGDYSKMVTQELDPINEVFLSSVKNQRPELSDEQMRGTVYFGSNAIKLGLADSIGTMEGAVAKVIELAKDESDNGINSLAVKTNAAILLAGVKGAQYGADLENQLKQNLEIINKNEMFESKLNKAVDKLAAKITAGEEILAEDVAPVNAELEAKGLKGYAIAKVEVVEALVAENETFKAEKLIAETALAASEKEVGRLGALAGAKHTNPDKPDGDEGSSDDEEKKFAALPHNAAAIEEVNKIV